MQGNQSVYKRVFQLCSTTDIVLQSGNKVALQTIALEDTTIKVGPARKTSYKGKMARRSKRSRRKDNQDRSECFHIPH